MPFGHNCEHANFAACVQAMTGKVGNPHGFCAALMRETEEKCRAKEQQQRAITRYVGLGAVMQVFGWMRFKIAWWRWFVEVPYGWEDNKWNRDILEDRWLQREPKQEDYRRMRIASAAARLIQKPNRSGERREAPRGTHDGAANWTPDPPGHPGPQGEPGYDRPQH